MARNGAGRWLETRGDGEGFSAVLHVALPCSAALPCLESQSEGLLDPKPLQAQDLPLKRHLW